MQRSAVIDNSSLIYLTNLHQTSPIFNYLKSLFHTVYFPSEVVKEYARGAVTEPYRNFITDQLNPEQGFYRLCNTYDSIVMAMVENIKYFDKGEAEAYAQLMKVNAHLIISDDKPFTEALLKINRGVRVFSSLHLICWLDILRLLPSWQNSVRLLHQHRAFKSKELRKAYNDIVAMLGLSVTKRTLSEKCSLSRIL